MIYFPGIHQTITIRDFLQSLVLQYNYVYQNMSRVLKQTERRINNNEYEVNDVISDIDLKSLTDTRKSY